MKTSYEIALGIDPEDLAKGHRWIKQSADHGFAPAIETEKLFVGRVSPPPPRQPSGAHPPAGGRN